jgi:hypothetical protein
MTDRQKAAALKRDLYAEKIDFKTFIMTVPVSQINEKII